MNDPISVVNTHNEQDPLEEIIVGVVEGARVPPREPETPAVVHHDYLLDFDRARIKTRIANWRRACNLLRLRRSFDKRGHGREAFRMLAEGYGMTEFDPLLDGIFKLKGFLSTMFFERRRT